MEQIVLHFVGDILLQNEWMAKNKQGFHRMGWLACFVHCMVYALPFSFALSLPGVLLVFICHFMIDKFSVARYYTNTFKVGEKYLTPNRSLFFLIFLVDLSLHLTTNFVIFHFYSNKPLFELGS